MFKIQKDLNWFTTFEIESISSDFRCSAAATLYKPVSFSRLFGFQFRKSFMALKVHAELD